MEYVAGEHLDRMPGGWEWLDRLEPLADALDLLHVGAWSAGVPLVHRDVKPANIVEAHDGRLVLVDPSSLRGADSTIVTRIGTPVFAAPEVITGRMGPPADVYSFAVTAVALLTGARGNALAELLADPDELDVPDGLRAGLAASPAARPVSCRAMLTEDEPALLRDVDGADEWGETWVLEGAGWAGVPGARRPVWPWVALLVTLVAAPLGAWATAAVTGRDLLVLAGGAFAVHLGAQLVARQPAARALLLPPVAWAFLIADRAVASGEVPGRLRRRRAWLRAVVTGALLAVTAGLLAPAGLPVTLTQTQALGLAAGGLALTGLAPGGAWQPGPGGLLLRLLLLVPWAAGAAVLLAGTAALLPLAVLTGRGASASRLIGSTIAGTGEALRSPPHGA
jgi:eukaryotic-like serine/threonine-protein kinase